MVSNVLTEERDQRLREGITEYELGADNEDLRE